MTEPASIDLERVMQNKTVRLSICVFAVLALATAFALTRTAKAGPGPSYFDGPAHPTLGPVVVDIPLRRVNPRDARTSMEVTATFPVDGGSCPLVVFSHGYGGAPNGYQHLIDYWAAHGYVVLAPTHADAGAILKPGGIGALGKVLNDPAACKQRIADMEDVIASVPAIERRIPQLRGKIDMSRIAAAGHSFGAYTTQLLGGATVSYAGDKPNQSFADPRLKCVLMLSPQGVNEMGLRPTSWKHMTVPAMTQTGSMDYPFTEIASAAKRLDPYKNAPAGGKYLVYIDKANHFTFCDLNSDIEARRPFLKMRHEREGMSQTDMYEYVKATSLAFLDTYLKKNSSAHAFLTGGSVEVSSRGIVKVESK